jgi:hypothetical protein
MVFSIGQNQSLLIFASLTTKKMVFSVGQNQSLLIFAGS